MRTAVGRGFDSPQLHVDSTWISVIVASGIAYLTGVFILTRFLAIGDVQWYERPIAWFWPVTIPILFLGWAVKEIFWPSR